MNKEDYYNHFGFNSLEEAIKSIKLGFIDDNHNTLLHALASYGTSAELQFLFKCLEEYKLNELYQSTTLVSDNGCDIKEDTRLLFLRGGHYNNLVFSQPISIYPFNNEQVVLENVQINSDYVHFYGVTLPVNNVTHFHVYKHDLMTNYYVNNGIMLENIKDYVNRLNDEKYSAVFLAIREYNLSNLKFLLDKGLGDVNARALADYTPLHYLCSFNDRQDLKNSPIQTKDLMLQYLLTKNVAICESAGINGLHPIHIAAMANNLSLVRILVDNGATLLEKTYDNNTVLHWACMRGSADLIDYCLSQSLFAGILNSKLQTALHLAVKEQPLSIIKSLVAHGYDINQMDAYGNTAFHYALLYKRFDLIDYFLPLSRPNIMNNEGETVMTLVAHYYDVSSVSNYFNVLTQFAKYHYVDSLKDSDHKTALDYMTERTNALLVKSLYTAANSARIEISLIDRYPLLVDALLRKMSDLHESTLKSRHEYYLGDKALEKFITANKDNRALKEMAGSLSITEYYDLMEEIKNTSYYPTESLDNNDLSADWQYRYTFLPFKNSHNDLENLKLINDESIYWFDNNGKSLLYYAILDHESSCVHKIINLYHDHKHSHYYMDTLGVSIFFCALGAININPDNTVDDTGRSIAKVCLDRDLNMSIGYDSSMKMALRLNDYDLVKLLLDNGYDVHHLDSTGHTVYDYALKYHKLDKDIIALLKEAK